MLSLLNYDMANSSECHMINKNGMENLASRPSSQIKTQYSSPYISAFHNFYSYYTLAFNPLIFLFQYVSLYFSIFLLHGKYPVFPILKK